MHSPVIYIQRIKTVHSYSLNWNLDITHNKNIRCHFPLCAFEWLLYLYTYTEWRSLLVPHNTTIVSTFLMEFQTMLNTIQLIFAVLFLSYTSRFQWSQLYTIFYFCCITMKHFKHTNTTTTTKKYPHHW